MTAPKPQGNASSEAARSDNRPKPVGRANLIYQQLLGELLLNRPRGLAGNVSIENVERSAQRWLK